MCPEQVGRRTNDAIEAGFFQAQIRQECCRVGRFELRDLELNRGAQRYGAGRRPSQERSESRLLRCAFDACADRRQICLIDIDHQRSGFAGNN